MFLWFPVLDLARAPRRTARKKGSGYENELGPVYMRPGRRQTGMNIEIVNTFKATFHSRILSVDWIGTDKNIFLCLVRSGLELMTLTQRNIFLFLAIHGYFS